MALRRSVQSPMALVRQECVRWVCIEWLVDTDFHRLPAIA